MNIKSLLLGSAAVVVAATGARAADAIVIPEPEPMEYVRVCDVYGAGFFYIPGTENCLKIGGYFRYQITAFDEAYADRIGAPEDGYIKLARFAPNFDVRTETAWGTLRGYAELEFDWGFSGYERFDDGSYRSEYGQSTNLLYGFIEVGNPGGVLRVGMSESPWSRFLGFGHSGWVDSGNYAFNQAGEVSYTFTSGAFSGIVALVEDEEDTNWMPNVEGGLRYDFAAGSFIGVIAGYDDFTETWGVRGVVDYTAGPWYAELGVFYSDHDDREGTYTVLDSAGRPTDWAVMGDLGYTVSPQVRLGLAGEYFFESETYEIGAQVAYSPFGNNSLVVKAEGRYYSDLSEELDDQDGFAGFLRFQRDF
ncbi:porin [Aquamicrobium sp. LC103]|uniref:porin n=1 Tax=Aquamicrobium sp. LC103 TaxID=1120658 RepID=UPI00069BA4A7|nr:porin [Aquamicrobium sp. LC103]TKT81290.1 porin [Aquamicrobium sp. LC103]